MNEHSDHLREFLEAKPLLWSIAYRMLGAVSDTEDILQEAYVRWQRAGADSDVRSPRAYLCSVVTRLCIDHLRSARVKRECYVGPWLPEPLVGESPDQPGELTELCDSLSIAFLRMLERLSPTERAVFLLREVFERDYAEVAATVRKTEVNCRQILRRARGRLELDRSRYQPSREESERLLQKFLMSCGTGDTEGLADLLAEEIELCSDGGGKVVAARRPVRGREKVARFLLGVIRNAPEGLQILPSVVNGAPGMVAWHEGQARSVLSLQCEGGRIQKIFIVVNPEKLGHIVPPTESSSLD